MTDPRFTARLIKNACEQSCINISTENSAHLALADVLRARGLEVRTEVRLNEKDRIDIMVGTVGVEVKTKGQRREIYNQLKRYAACPEVEALVLATSTPWPSHMTEIDGKPFSVASLTAGWL